MRSNCPMRLPPLVKSAYLGQQNRFRNYFRLEMNANEGTTSGRFTEVANY